MVETLIVCLSCVALFALAVRAVARACFCELADGATAGAAWAWGASFVVQALGCMLLLRDGYALAAAGFALVVLVLSAASVPLACRCLSERVLVQQAHGANVAFEVPGGERSRMTGLDCDSGKTIAVRCALVARAYDLTRREEDVLRLLVGGMTVAQIADRFVLSPNTVKSHVRNLYRKFGVSSRSGLADRLAAAGADTTGWDSELEREGQGCFLVVGSEAGDADATVHPE